MPTPTKMITLFKGLLLDDWKIYEYEKVVVVCDASGNRAFCITENQLLHLKNAILLSKEVQPTRNVYKLMTIEKTEHLTQPKRNKFYNTLYNLTKHRAN